MTELKKKGESKYWIGLILFLLIITLSSLIFVNIKKRSRLDRYNHHLNSDLLFLKDHVIEGLHMGNYTNVDSFLRGWANLHYDNIIELKLSTQNDFIISHFKKEINSQYISEHNINIEYSYDKKAILHVKVDMSFISHEVLQDYFTVGFILIFASFALIYITRLALKRRSIVHELEKQAVELMKLSSAVEQSPSSIVITDINGDIEYINPKFSQLTGYSFEDVVGQNLRILKSDKLSNNEYMKLWEIVTRGEIWHGEFLNKKKNGDLYWEDATIGPIKNENGSITNFIAIKEDISERKNISKELKKYQDDLENLVKERTLELEAIADEMKENQQALMYLVEDANESRAELEVLNKKLNRSLTEIESSKDHIDGILKSVADGLIVTDFDNNVILVNHIVEELFNVRSTDIIGKPIDSFINDKDHLEKLSIAFSDSEYGHSFDFEVSSNVKNSCIYNARVSAIWDKNGVITGLITTFREVTREREIDRMKTEFISTSAHELRTPLTSIQGFSEILLTRKNLKKEERKRFLEYINKQSISLGNIINDLLDISKIESGLDFILKKEKCKTREVLESVVNSFKDISKKHTFRVEYSVNPVVDLYVDKKLIHQAISNLISNAVKYSPDGGEILISEDTSEGNYIISVYDEGIGMTPEHIERIFEKFYRADASNTAIEGTGLGMSIVKHIVASHGGEIWVESEPGKWTRVTFVIPLKEKKGKNVK